jgi:hypothetical protein
MSCSLYTSAGCPSLTINNFWTFLNNNSIWFAIVLWVVSLFELLFGYFVIRLTIMIYGIMSGSLFGVIYTAENYIDFLYENDGYGISVFIILLSVFMGILFGIVLLTMPKLGYINIGVWVAVIFTLLLQNSCLYLTGSLLAFYIVLGITALVMASISLLALRYFVILSTTFTSAFWLIRPLGFFLPYYPN